MSDAEMAPEELRRKYKIMEGNRKSYVEDAQNHIRRQRQTIDKLTRQLAAQERAQRGAQGRVPQSRPVHAGGDSSSR